MTHRPRRPSAAIAALAVTTTLALVMSLPAGASPNPGMSPGGSAAPVTLVPEDASITIGYADDSALGRLPLILAESGGYFREAGFAEVLTTQADAPLPGVLAGDLDLAIVDARQAMDARAMGLPVQAVAGHRVVPVGGPQPDASPWPSVEPGSPWASVEVVVATSDSVEHRPGTIAAFTVAYVRALGDLRARALGVPPSSAVAPDPSGPATSAAPSASTTGDPIRDAAVAAGVVVGPDLLDAWPAALEAYIPFDGGFDEPTGDGLGSLRNRYLDDPNAMRPG